MADDTGGGDGGTGTGDGTGGGGGDSGAGGGNAGGDFILSLPAELQSAGPLQGFKGAEGGRKLAESYVHLSSKLGSRSMADMDIPATADGIKAVLTKLGRAAPDNPDGYKLADKSSSVEFRALAHKHGLTAAQAEGMFGEMDARDVKAASDRDTRATARKEATESALRGEWGSEYDGNAAHSKQGLDHFFGEEMQKALEISGLGNHPEMQKLLYAAGRHMAEGTMHTGAGAAQGNANTVETATIERDKFLAENSELILSQDDMSSANRAAKEKHRQLNQRVAQLIVQARNDAAAGTGA